MFDGQVRVVRRPRVMHRDTTEPVDDTEDSHPFTAAFFMADDQGVLVGAGAVHPVQLTGDPEPGLVEADHIRAGQPPADLIEEPAQAMPWPGASMPATVPADTGVPNNSARACAVRCLDRNCPTYR